MSFQDVQLTNLERGSYEIADDFDTIDYQSKISGKLRRKTTLVRPDRAKSTRKLVTTKEYQSDIPNNEFKKEQEKEIHYWRITVLCLTFWLPDFVLLLFGKKDQSMRQITAKAFREKLVIVFIFLVLCAFVAFLSFGINVIFCPDGGKSPLLSPNQVKAGNFISAFGNVYNATLLQQIYPTLTQQDVGTDITRLFNIDRVACSNFFTLFNPCTLTNTCLDKSLLSQASAVNKVVYEWADIYVMNDTTLFNGFVLLMKNYIDSGQNAFGDKTNSLIKRRLSQDLTYGLRQYDYNNQISTCLTATYTVGVLTKETVGCFITNSIMIFTLVVVMLIMGMRFIMAILFNWILTTRLDIITKKYKISYQTETAKSPVDHVNKRRSVGRGKLYRAPYVSVPGIDFPYCMILVTCYSEGEDSIKGTLDSLAQTDYPDPHKLFFIVCDGLVKGSGNALSTPEIVKQMIEILPGYENPEPRSYLAVADGSKRHNKALVYPGHYILQGRQVPTILIVKCGTEGEKGGAKPGNRGKRDSQLILMNLLKCAVLNENMSPLDYDIFEKILALSNVPVSEFESVLMVDADTRVDTEALSRMIAAMQQDPLIVGLCGETRIANKRTSWVTRIQVFEYYISHHLAKAFEAMFGGFSMMRIKAPKNGKWVPVLCHPDIINEYSEYVVETLHQKNLLLLGEDRFLTTLMLRTFPRRKDIAASLTNLGKMIFVPQAVCRTTVPDEFRILLSQRRRWINSTIHNLMELILVRDLCGIFCCSMQFVVFIELFGTAVLPAALIFTIILIVKAVAAGITSITNLIPLIILVMVLFLPGILVLLTTRRYIYIYWLLVYLLALPIWNFVLPVYAVWHQDDFSWGQTRKVDGDKGDHGNKQGEFNDDDVPKKPWAEWKKEPSLSPLTEEYLYNLE